MSKEHPSTNVTTISRKLIDEVKQAQSDPHEHIPSRIRHLVMELQKALGRNGDNDDSKGSQ